jgi:NAD(P)-dependent dehydrogenase (short-subunit alcohol dehydrogenase family)
MMPAAMKLKDKVALVTGASRGIGQATAVALAEAGAKVAVNYNTTAEGAQETLKRIKEGGGEAEAIQADMGDPAQITNLFEQAVKRFGRIDVYVNNANAGRRERGRLGTYLDVTPDQLYQEFLLPYQACYLGGQQAAKQMIAHGGGGAIVNISSVHQYTAWPADSVYGSMKAAISRLTKSQARELAPHKIRVNCIAPGFIDIRAHPGERGERYDIYNQRAEYEIPLGRGVPSDIANGVLYFVTDDSRYVTGQTLFVEGGYLIPPISEI